MGSLRGIECKSPREIDIMRRAGQILADVMDRLRGFVEPGMTTLAIDVEVEKFIKSHSARPAFKKSQPENPLAWLKPLLGPLRNPNTGKVLEAA